MVARTREGRISQARWGGNKKSEAPPKSDSKKSRKARYKGGITSDVSRKKKTKVGLDVFKVKQRGTDGKVRLKAVEKEDGIHSRQWALAIAPQPDSPLLSMPLEIRQKIYIYALWSHAIPKDYPYLTPGKSGNHYVNKTPFNNGRLCLKDKEFVLECLVVHTYNTLSILNKQTYLDVVGSSLLYKTIPFSFESMYAIENYIQNINPIHPPSIQSLSIVLASTPSSPSFPPSVFRTLASLTGLKHLDITILVNMELLDNDYVEVHYEVKKDVLRMWKDARWDLLGALERLEGGTWGLEVNGWMEGYWVFHSHTSRRIWCCDEEKGEINGVDEIRKLVGARV